MDAQNNSLVAPRVVRLCQDDVQGSLLGVFVRSPSIVTDDSDAESIERTEKKNGEHGTGVTRYDIATCETHDEHDTGQANGEDKAK